MGGGKSSSSADSTNVTTTTTGTSTGNLGYVVQGETINIDQNVSDQVVEVFNQLVGLASKSIDLSTEAGKAALQSTQNFATKVVQPDVAVVESSQKQNYYVVGAVAAAIVLILVLRK